MEIREHLKISRRGIDPLKAFKFTNGDREANSRYYAAALTNWQGNAEHHQLVYDWLKKPRNFLVYLGNRGVGKTHLLCALLWWFWERGDEVYAVRAHDYFNSIHQDMSEGKNQFNQNTKLSDQQILLFDDLGATQGTDWQQQMIGDLMDRRYNSRLPTVVTSNLTFKEMEKSLGFRTQDRLSATENVILQDWTESKRQQGK